jgi:hypothetical protein
MAIISPTAAVTAAGVLFPAQGDHTGSTAQEVLSLVEHKTRGIVPSSKYTTLEEAAVAAVGKTLYLNSNLTVSSVVDLTNIPVMVAGGRFTQGGGGAISFGSFSAGNVQVFYGFTGGISGAFEELNPTWFGTADLNTLLTIIGTNECELLVNKTLTQSAPATVPETCFLDITKKGYINQGVHALAINSAFERRRARVFLGTGPVTFGPGAAEVVYPEYFSGTGGVKQAWEASASNSKVSLHRKEYVEPLGISNLTRGGTIEGYVGERNNEFIKGSVIRYTGSGDWFANGSESSTEGIAAWNAGTSYLTGNFALGSNGKVYKALANNTNVDPTANPATWMDYYAWDVDNYGGPQTVTFTNFSVKYGGAMVPLSNGSGYYGADTCGIRDWRGGTIRMKGMQFENWDYPFWGLQSDINELDATILYCEHGFFLGPRSDQLKLKSLYALYCTQALILDGCVAWVDNLILKECGHEAKCPVEIRQVSTNNRQSHFGQVWAEDYGGGTASYVNAFFDVGISAGNNGLSTLPAGVLIDEMTYWDHGTPPKTKHLAQVGKGFVRIRNPKGDYSNIDSLIDFVGGYDNTLATGHVEGPSFLGPKCFTNSGGGTPKMTHLLDGPEGLVFGSSSNKQFFRRLSDTGAVDAAKSYGIFMAVDGQLVIDQPDLETDNNTILHLNRRHYQGLVANPGDIPVGPHGPFTLRRGDDYTVTNSTAGQPHLYACTLTGTYGDYAALENRTATTTLATPTVVTLSAATTKLFKEQAIAIAGAGPAGATLNTSIVSVAANGLSIVIADAASTAGAGLAISFRAPTTRTISLS